MSINHQLDGVFIHVTDMQQAISWYSHLLGLPKRDVSHEGMIYELPLSGSTQIILDAYPKVSSPRGTGPRLMFSTSDIEIVRAHAQILPCDMSDVQDIGSSLVMYIEDPDGNVICVRQPKSSETELLQAT